MNQAVSVALGLSLGQLIIKYLMSFSPKIFTFQSGFNNLIIGTEYMHEND
jgi:hypothetical protein